MHLRRSLRYYPLYWRQLNGEELVATTLDGMTPDDLEATHLPRSMRHDLRKGALRARVSALGAPFLLLWWYLTGRPLRPVDRWRIRDLYVTPNRQLWRLMFIWDWVILTTPLPSPWSAWLQSLVVVPLVGLFVVVAVCGTWRWRRGSPRLRNLFRGEPTLRALGFTVNGVPFDWLYAPPNLPPPPSMGDRTVGFDPPELA